ncbi:MAG TPA: ArgR family transcriptional regulator, partial [Terriglobales bacterium]
GLPSAHRLVREFVVDLRPAQNLLVLKTAVGSAQPVAARLDAESWPEVVGTVAGDDTILIISPDKKACGRLAQRIREMLA